MKKILVLLILVLSINSYAYDKNTVNSNFNQAGIPTRQINLSQPNWILYDKLSNQVIEGQNITQRINIGDFNRLMLLYILFNKIKSSEINLNSKINLDKKTIEYIKQNTTKDDSILDLNKSLLLKDIILASFINNNKDALYILVDILNKENDLVEKMNKTAKMLDMKDTSFQNFLGKNHHSNYSSPQDIILLMNRIEKDYASAINILKQKSFIYNNITHYNKNYVLNLDKDIVFAINGKIDGQECLLINKKRTEKDTTQTIRDITALVIKSKDINQANQDTLRLLNYGYSEFNTRKIYDANYLIANSKIWLGKEDIVKIGVLKDVYITIPKGDIAPRLNTILDKPKYIYAPIKKGESIAYIKLTNENKEIYKIPVVALDEVKEANFLSRWFDKLRLIFS